MQIMEQKYYILKNNIITGPFTRDTLIDLLNRDRLLMSDYVSTDKKSWKTPQEALKLVMPAKPAANPEIPPGIPDSTITAAEPENIDPICEAEEPDTVTENLNFTDLLLHVIASLGNGSGYFHRFSCMSRQTMLSAGITAAIFSLLFGAGGSLMFGNCYNISPLSLCIRTVALIVSVGALFYLLNTIVRVSMGREKLCNAAVMDFLCAMTAMMNVTAISITINGTAFIFNRQLFDMSLSQTAAVAVAALLPLLFFICNIILLLRFNFMANCKLKPGISTLLAILEFYLVTISGVSLLYVIYHTA